MSATDWTEGGAEFDVSHRDGIKPKYRHHLWRGKPTDLVGRHLIHRPGRRLGVCMHNPSNAGADPRDNDPTVVKLIGFADRWGFDRLDVVNFGDLIATDPKDFYSAHELLRVSDRCDERIREVARAADVMLVAWGALTKWWALERSHEVMRLIDRSVVCIATTKHGHPQHPLMARYTDAPLPFEDWK